MIAEIATMFCLTTMIYNETRGEPIKGKIAVAHVALNRIKKSKKDMCSVLHEPYQFEMRLPSKYARQSPAWEDAHIIASLVINGKTVDPTKGATHFHAHYVNPSWNKIFTHTATIGGHKFYKQ